MAAPPQNLSFQSLPTELQVQVYEYILADSLGSPSPGNLAPYAGLLLSCEKVASDFEHQWAKDFTARLQHITKNTNLHPLPIKKYCHAAHLRVLVPQPRLLPTGFKVSDLTETTRLFILRLSDPAQGLTAHELFSFIQFRHLEALQLAVGRTRSVSCIDFRTQELRCVSHPSLEQVFWRNEPRILYSLPGKIFAQIFREALSKNATAEELCNLSSVWDQSSHIWDVFLRLIVWQPSSIPTSFWYA